MPPAAVLFADETAYVFAVADGKAVKLRVQVGRTDPAGVHHTTVPLAEIPAALQQATIATEDASFELTLCS